MQPRFEKERLARNVDVSNLNLNELLKRSNDFRWDLRGAVCEQIGELTELTMSDLDTITDRMLALANDDNWYVKRAAWRTLGRLNLSGVNAFKVFKRLTGQIEEGDQDARLFAYKTFGIISWTGYLNNFIHQPVFFQWLIDAIQPESDPEIYIAGLQLLKTFLSDDDLQKTVFYSILKDAHSYHYPQCREAMYELLGAAEWPVSLMEDVQDTLIKGINDPVCFVARAACNSLMNLSWPEEFSKKLVDFFLQQLNNPNSKSPLLELSCEALGKLDLSSSDNEKYSLILNKIILLTSAEIPSVRSTAWNTLAKYPSSLKTQTFIFKIVRQNSTKPECSWHLLMDYYRILGEFPWVKEIKTQAKALLVQAMCKISDPYLSATASKALASLSSDAVASPVALSANQSDAKLSTFWDRFFISKIDPKNSLPVSNFALK